MPTKEPIIAVGLLTRSDITLLGNSFDRLWPVEETPCFGALLAAIDEADREFWRGADASERNKPPQAQNSMTIKVR